MRYYKTCFCWNRLLFLLLLLLLRRKCQANRGGTCRTEDDLGIIRAMNAAADICLRWIEEDVTTTSSGN